jgi:hypothetical protein
MGEQQPAAHILEVLKAPCGTGNVALAAQSRHELSAIMIGDQCTEQSHQVSDGAIAMRGR